MGEGASAVDVTRASVKNTGHQRVNAKVRAPHRTLRITMHRTVGRTPPSGCLPDDEGESAMSEISCPICSRRLRVSEDMAGTPIRCPMCQSVFETAPTDEPLLGTPTAPGDAFQTPPRAPKLAPSATRRGESDARRDWGQDRDEAPARQESCRMPQKSHLPPLRLLGRPPPRR